MLGLGVSEELQVALLDASMLALLAVLPVFAVGYARQLLAARRLRPEFSLRLYEAIELNRALTEYERVWRRRKELLDVADGARSWWRTLLRPRTEIASPHVDEFDMLVLGQFENVVGRIFGHRSALLCCELRTTVVADELSVTWM